MAEKIALVETFLNCPVCLKTFTDPVSLSCNHSFCSSCLKEFWENSENKTCPICRRRSSKEDLIINFALKNLADSFAGRQESGSSETDRGQKKKEVVCSKHQQVPELFCEREDRVVCPLCESSLHVGHRMVHVEEAVSDLKELLRSDLESLQDKRDKYKQVKNMYNEVIQHSKKQVVSTEEKIRAEFNKLHQFLKEEEESRLAALWYEEEQKKRQVSKEMKMIEEQISSLSDSISAVEEDLQKDSRPFLNSYKDTRTRVKIQSSLSDPQLASGVLIDVAKHLGNLSFRVWEKMKDKVHFSPVILDPNTANSCLSVSDDLTAVRYMNTGQQLPDNPERCTKYTDVLGSEGFGSGKHSWEVEVGDLLFWNVGLVKESAARKREPKVSRRHVLWCLQHGNGKYNNLLGETIPVKKRLHRIRVQLDYAKGEVSFYDPEDMRHIYTHRDTFTENLLPLIGVGQPAGAKTTEVRICPTESFLFDVQGVC